MLTPQCGVSDLGLKTGEIGDDKQKQRGGLSEPLGAEHPLMNTEFPPWSDAGGRGPKIHLEQVRF